MRLYKGYNILKLDLMVYLVLLCLGIIAARRDDGHDLSRINRPIILGSDLDILNHLVHPDGLSG